MNSAAQELRDLYRELILDHSRSPRHFGRMEDATHVADGINPLCGDKLRLYLRVTDDGTIAATSFEGSGCAISMASTSLMTDAVSGIPLAEAEACIDAITSRLTTAQAAASLDPRLEKLQALEGVREFPGRVKCATLAWRALHAAINNDNMPATTE